MMSNQCLLPHAPPTARLAVSSGLAKQTCLDDDLEQAAEAWAAATQAEEEAQQEKDAAESRLDRARWAKAEAAGSLYDCWESDGLTFSKIAERFGIPDSTVKLYVGVWQAFGGREDRLSRRFSDWCQMYQGLRSALQLLVRIRLDGEVQGVVRSEVNDRLTDAISNVVNDSHLKTNRQIRVATKAAVERLVNQAHARSLSLPTPSTDPIRLMDGIDLIASPDDGPASLVVLDAPYGTGANPRRIRMANDTPEEARELLVRVAPLLKAKLADNGFLVWFRPGFDIDQTDEFKPILREHFSMRQMVWAKTRSGLSAEGRKTAHCYELMFLLWPKERPQPVPYEVLPDLLFVSHDSMSGPSSEHPSAKPVALFERLIRATTMPGDLVLDPFAGTGAAVEAALTLERRIAAAEIVPDIFNMAETRLAKARVDLSDDPTTAAFVAERGITAV